MEKNHLRHEFKIPAKYGATFSREKKGEISKFKSSFFMRITRLSQFLSIQFQKISFRFALFLTVFGLIVSKFFIEIVKISFWCAVLLFMLQTFETSRQIKKVYFAFPKWYYTGKQHNSTSKLQCKQPVFLDSKGSNTLYCNSLM